MVAEGDENHYGGEFSRSPGGLCSRLQQGLEDVIVCRRVQRWFAGLPCHYYVLLVLPSSSSEEAEQPRKFSSVIH